MPLGLGHVHDAGGLAGGGRLREHHFLELRAERPPHDRRAALLEHRLVHVELVGVDRALHHHFAEPVGRGDEDHVAEPRFGVEREEHAARAEVAAHHLLHRRRQRDRAVGESLVHAVGDRAVVVERGEHVAHRLEHVVGAADVEEGLLLAGERGFGQVFRGSGRTHRERGLVARLPLKLLIMLPNLLLQRRRKRGVEDPRADLLAGGGERLDVRGIERGKALGDALFQTI